MGAAAVAHHLRDIGEIDVHQIALHGDDLGDALRRRTQNVVGLAKRLLERQAPVYFEDILVVDNQQRIDILAQFLIESILISVTGGLIGVVFGIGAAVVVNLAAAFPIYIQPWSVLLSFAVCTLTGVFFGWYPAQKAAMLDPIEAIRYE